MPRWWEELLHITIGRVSRHDDLPDLRHLPTRPVALERTHYLVNDRERRGQERRAYVLRSEPDRRSDVAGVAVFSNGRNVGHLPAEVAGVVGPQLDLIGGAAVVNGAGTKQGSIRLWVDLPLPDDLREFVLSADSSQPRDVVSR